MHSIKLITYAALFSSVQSVEPAPPSSGKSIEMKIDEFATNIGPGKTSIIYGVTFKSGQNGNMF